MSNRYSNFPDALDELKLLSEVQEMSLAQKQKVARYLELSIKTLNVSEEVEFQRLIQELKGFQLNSSDWNKVVETLMNTQKYIKEKMLGEVSILINEAEITVQNKVDKGVLDISTTAENAKAYINDVLVNTEVELGNRISEIVSNGTSGIDYFKGRTVLALDTAYIKVNVPQYNRTTDFLMVYVNGSLITEGVNYIIRPDNFTLESTDGNWESGTVFDFLILKRTIIVLKYYDAGLFEDGTIRKEKLTLGLQNEIISATTSVSELNANKQNKSDTSLNTKSKTVVGGINELLTEKQNKQDSSLVTTNKTIVGAINEVFTSASNGKTKIAVAVTGKGIPTSANDSFDVIANNINKLANVTIDGSRPTGETNFTLDLYSSLKASSSSVDYTDVSAVVFEDAIHILGGYKEGDKKRHMKWDGGTWNTVSTLPVNFTSCSAVVYKGELHMLGNSDTYNTHYKWNGISWTKLPDLPVEFYGNCKAFIYKNELHIINRDSVIYKWNEVAWTMIIGVPANVKDGVVYTFVYNDCIYIFYSNYCSYWDGLSWSSSTDSAYYIANGGAIAYKDGIYAVTHQNHFLKYDTNAREWIKKSDLTYEGSYINQIVFRDKIHYFCGDALEVYDHRYIEEYYRII